MFIDRVVLYVKGGDGGAGCCSFRREKYVPRGGPDGGDGGDGGSVILRAVAGTDSLAALVNRKHWAADSGGGGGSDNCHGRRGRDLILNVPPGTLILDRDRGNVLRDLTEAGQEVNIARGGRGGRGNRAFATATNRAPRQTQPGTPGEERWIILELKLIADAGLVGLPNAGKSTLLSRLSQARPEVADYPFTTRHPNLGLVTVGGERAFVLADLPGLIEGAHSGVGLGHEFLRHVERTRVLVHLVEPLPADGSDPVQNYHVIRRELELHSRQLASKPEVVALSKAELTGSGDVRERLERELGRPVLAISAVTGQGLSQLVGSVVAELSSGQPVLRTQYSVPSPPVADAPGSPFGPPVADAPGSPFDPPVADAPGSPFDPPVADAPGSPNLLVVDIGNSRTKWGRCRAGAVVESVSLPSDDPLAWQQQLDLWALPGPLSWVLTSVQPKDCDRLAGWLRQRGDVVRVIASPRELPLRVMLDNPERVGIDRLLDAVAANSRRQPGCPAALIDAGSAVTVDYVDEDGSFRGGAILPGLRLMAHALHEHTALLPLIPLPQAVPQVPGTTTPAAMDAGIFWAVVGGIRALIEEYRRLSPQPLDVFLTGGDSSLLHRALGDAAILWPLMTLEGVRLVVENAE